MIALMNQLSAMTQWYFSTISLMVVYFVDYCAYANSQGPGLDTSSCASVVSDAEPYAILP